MHSSDIVPHQEHRRRGPGWIPSLPQCFIELTWLDRQDAGNDDDDDDHHDYDHDYGDDPPWSSYDMFTGIDK